ncbi:hypothetical protein MED297_10841 [Reinekea sp. MED297]|uniref:Orphan protein n=2 Tax=Reinekea TaxID=230494 RepID=A4BAP6_9GAMM|nr:hypothetical protein MED297_10841 [Reinekea sp. MED297] [Reinekea blandensis MED297]
MPFANLLYTQDVLSQTGHLVTNCHGYDIAGGFMSFETQISNYYEKLVVEELGRREDLADTSDDVLIDMACVALNQLPSRYYRYSVDMAFYLSASENQAMEADVKSAVDHAISFVQAHKSRA